MAEFKVLSGIDLNKKRLKNALLQDVAELDTNEQIGYDSTRGEIAWRHSGSNKTVRDVTLDKFAAPVADVNMNNYKLTGLAPGTSANDAVTKSQLDAVSAGLDPKKSVRVATTSTLTLTTDYTRSGSGSSHVLTATANGVLSIDGVNSGWVDIDNDGASADPFASSPATRVLVKDASDAKDNGIYAVKDKGSVSTPWKLIRSGDFDGTPANEVSGGNFVLVEQGTTNGGTGWSVVADGDVTVDTHNINWTKFNSPGATTGGTGIAQTGTTLFLQNATGTTTLTFGADDLQVNLASSGGLEDSSGVKIKKDTTGGTNLARAVNLSSNGLAVKIDDTTIKENASQQLSVNFASVLKQVTFTTVGGSATESFTHNLNNRNVFAFVRHTTTHVIALAQITASTVNSITLDFGTDPGTNYQVVVWGLDLS